MIQVSNKWLLGAMVLGTLFSACRQPDMSMTTSVEVPVSVIEVEKSSIEEYINTTGTVYAMKEVTINSEMAGEYHLQTNPRTGKPYALGDFVAEGAVIIKIEDEEYVNNLRTRSKKVDYEISKQEYEKQQSLYEKGGATLRELKNAEISLINSEYDVESSEIDLAKMKIVAPFAGEIASLPYFTEGTKIASNTELVQLVDYKKLYLEPQLPEKNFANVGKGLKVYITSYTNPYDTLIGQVTQLSPVIDPDARTFKTFVEIGNPDSRLLPGMFVKADLVMNSSENTIVIPKDIVVSRNRQRFVFVVDKGVAQQRAIAVGLEGDKNLEVTSGLSVGETIVSRGFETLRDGSRVKVLK